MLSTLAVLFLVLEGVGRLLTKPSHVSYGRLLGVELPPLILRVDPLPARTIDRTEPYKDVVVDGVPLTRGDLEGAFRSDDRLGYAPEEGWTSTHEWWRTNRMGARSPVEISREVPPEATRVLLFGDSFAAGSRVRFEESWAARLSAARPDLEVVNFGVDGYGMGQAFLRYQTVRDSLEHDVVILMLVPGMDLWRDVSVRRDVCCYWVSSTVMPRFAITDDGRAELVVDPRTRAAAPGALSLAARDSILRAHLRRYDRTYVPALYEQTRFMSRSILRKLAAAAYGEWKRRTVRRGLFELDSEAARVTAAIIGAMRREVEEDGKRFGLVMAASTYDLRRPQTDPRWDEEARLIGHLCGIAGSCLDLAKAMRRMDRGSLDVGYDGSHFGPRASIGAAALIGAWVEEEGWIGPGQR